MTEAKYKSSRTMNLNKAKSWLRQEAETLSDARVILSLLESLKLNLEPEIHFKNEEGDYVWKEDVKVWLKRAYRDFSDDLTGAHLSAYISHLLHWYLEEVTIKKPRMDKVIEKVRKNLEKLVENSK